MPAYEYKVVPAPNRGVKAKGVKGTAARFAHGLENLMNEAGAEGWEYLRADLLPCEERQGLRSRVPVDQHVLVFRRKIQSQTDTLLVTDPVVTPARVPPEMMRPPSVAAAPEGQQDGETPSPFGRLGPATRAANVDGADQ